MQCESYGLRYGIVRAAVDRIPAGNFFYCGGVFGRESCHHFGASNGGLGLSKFDFAGKIESQEEILHGASVSQSATIGGG